MLNEALEAKGLRLLCVADAGPTAWGLGSGQAPVIRAVFCHPAVAYISVREPQDHFTPDDLPTGALPPNGLALDIKPLLLRIAQSDPGTLGWLHSPIWLQDPLGLQVRLQRLAEACCAPRALGHYYTELATKLFAAKVARADDPTAGALFDVARNVLAARWAITRRTPPPLAFAELQGGFANSELNTWATSLFISGMSLEVTPSFEDTTREALLEELQQALQDCHDLPGGGPDFDLLDAFFRDVVGLGG